MAKVLEPISDAELKKITVVNLRNEYKKLSNFLCGRTQIIIFAACSRECNVFSLG